MTVTRVLRHPEKVSLLTRERVTSAIEAVQYVPDLIARSLASQHTGVVAVVVPSLANSLIAEVTQGMSQTFARHGRQVMVGASNYSSLEEEALVRAFLARRVDAIYVTGTSQTATTLRLLRESGIPVVQGGNISDAPLDLAVGTSNSVSARALVDHLIARYGTDLAMISGPLADNDRMRDRRRGFLSALAAHGVTPDSRWLLESPISMEGGRTGLAALLTLPHRPRALFCASDVIAAGAIFECQRQGLAVPGDLAIAGYDDLDIAAHMRPSLTTVRIPRFEIGVKAAEMIDAALAGTRPAQKSIEMGYEIMRRESA